MRTALATILLVLLAPWPARAETDPSTPRLEWRAPPECIRARELDHLVTTELGRSAFDPTARELVVRGRVTLSPNGTYRTDVELLRASGDVLGVRRIDSDNRQCRSLDEALAVMLAIMLNVNREERAHEAPSRVTWRAAVGGFVSLGRMPGAGLEVLASGGPVWRGVTSFDAELGLELGPSRSVAEGSVEARAGTVRLGLSPVLFGGTPELSLRLGGGAGLLEATAAGFDRVTRRVRPTAEGRVGLRLAFPVARPLLLEIAADFGVMPLRPSFSVVNAGGSREELFRPALVFGTLGLSLAFRPG